MICSRECDTYEYIPDADDRRRFIGRILYVAATFTRPYSLYQRHCWGSLAGPERVWRTLFLLGLLLGGVLTRSVIGQAVPAESPTPLWLIANSGLLVGLGTRMGGGCTSGHGVCGLGRRSPRSLVATLTFMTLGVITVFIMQSVMGGAL